MAKIIAIANQKGGVAKTFTSRSFATCLAMKGYKVLAVDGDPQGDLTRQFDISDSELADGATLTTLIKAEVENRSNLDDDSFLDYNTEEAIISTDDNVDVLSATLALTTVVNQMTNAMNRDYIMRDILDQVYDDYDFIIIDCPPNLGYLVINHLATADYVIIPAFTDEQSLTSMNRLITTITSVAKITNPDLTVDGILFTNVQMQTTIAKRLMDTVRECFPIYTYETYIPSGVSAKNAVANHVSIFDQDKNGPVAKAYERFTEEFLERHIDEVPPVDEAIPEEERR